MAVYIQKFGGTSLASVERIRAVAEIIAKTVAEGHQVVAVVSAMGGETDRLIQLTKQLSSDGTEREFAAAVASGEQVSAALLALALNHTGCQAKSYTGWQAQIQTTNQYRKARITHVNADLLRIDLHEHTVPVITGYQGIDDQNNMTTLGRGGSDLTAVALAAALDADECQIFSDVEGVFTSDPRLVDNVRLLEQISYDEMLALADLGAKVLHNRAVEFAQKYAIPLRVLSSFEPGKGTLVTSPDEKLKLPVVSGVAVDHDQAKLSIVGALKASEMQQFFKRVREAGIDIDMLVQNTAEQSNVNMSFTVHREDFAEALALSNQLAESLQSGQVHGDEHIAKLSLVGLGMNSHAAVAGKIFHVLGEEGIDIHLISSTEAKISTVIDEENLQKGAQLLHKAFQLSG